MATNNYKLKRDASSVSFFSKIEKLLRIDMPFEHGLPVKYLPYILFVVIIGIFYIGNSHFAEKNVRKIDSLKKEVEDLRADYTTLKADHMYDSKQSEVARKVKNIGIIESLEPPKKIIIKKGEY